MRGVAGARAATRPLVLLLVLLGALLATTAPAQALSQRGHSYDKSLSFGAKGSGEGQFERPAGIAISHESGDIYVADRGNNRVEVFEQVSGSAPKYLRSLSVPYPLYVAVDNSSEGSDPSRGDVYVVGTTPAELKELEPGAAPEHFEVYKFNSRGTLVDKLKRFKFKEKIENEKGEKETETYENEEFEVLTGVAVDQHGSVFLASEEEIYEYSDAVKNRAAAAPIIPPAGEVLPGLAIDSHGDIYAGAEEPVEGSAQEATIAGDIQAEDEEEGIFEALLPPFSFDVVGRFDPATGKVEVPSLDEELTTAVAVDTSGEQPGGFSELDYVYAVNESPGPGGTRESTIAAFTPAHQLIQRFGASGLQEGDGIAIEPKTGEVYVTDAGSDKVFVFGFEGPGAPTVAGLSACVLGGGSGCPAQAGKAKLSGRVDPHGSKTTYRFQLGTESCSPEPSPCTLVAEGSAGEGYADRELAAEASGLATGTYHYRLLASNEAGVAAQEGTFTVVTAAQGLPDNREWEIVSPQGREKEGEPEPAVTAAGGTMRAAEDGDAVTYFADGPMGAGVEGSRNPEYAQVLSTRSEDGWSSQDITTPNDTGSGLHAGHSPEYTDFSPNLALALVEPFPGAEKSGDFAEPALSLPITPGEEALRAEGKPYQEKTIYLRDDAPLAPEAAEAAHYEAAAANGKAMGNQGYLPLVTQANSPEWEEEREGKKVRLPFGGGVGVVNIGLEFANVATPDLGHVVFDSYKAKPGVYEWGPEEGFQLLSALPEESAAKEGAPRCQGSACIPTVGQKAVVPGANTGSSQATNARHAISEDGSLVFLSSIPALPARRAHLFVRDTITQETVRLDIVQAGASGKGPISPEFLTASADGSRVFFSDTQRLTSDSKAGEEAPDLYVAELEGGRAPGEPLVVKLSDLTPEGINGERAELAEHGGSGGVLGASEDGTYVYFAASAALAPGAERGECNSETCNLYMRHFNGSEWEPTRLVATVSAEDSPDWAGIGGKYGDLAYMTSRVSPNGEYFAFMSSMSLTRYDNEDVTGQGRLDEEVYLYHAGGGELVCASCNPSGAQPHGIFDESTGLENGVEPPLVDRLEIWAERGVDPWLAGSVPGWTNVNEMSAPYQSRYLSNSGRLFFDSPDALVPAVQREVEEHKTSMEKVYEYEPDGVGSCELAGGCIALISKAGAQSESAFLDASANGNDVFFLTAEKLSPQDTDDEYDVYDAHVCEPSSPCLKPPAPGRKECEEAKTCRPGKHPLSEYEAPATTSAGTGNGTTRVQVLGEKTEVKPVTPTKKLTASQKLSAALAQCAKQHSRSKRAACEKKARAKYEPLIRAERLAAALRTCRKQKSRSKRSACERQARKRYGAYAASTSSKKGARKR